MGRRIETSGRCSSDHARRPGRAPGSSRAAAPACMTEHAVLVLEIGNEREHFEAAFPTLAAVWLETSAGEDQVLLLTRAAIDAM